MLRHLEEVEEEIAEHHSGEATVAHNPGELAERGVAYVTVAHLFWRRVATHANAIPFPPNPLFDFFFPQPPIGLTDLARAAVQAMVRRRVLMG